MDDSASLNDEDPTPCKHVSDLARDQLDLMQTVMRRLDQQDRRIAGQEIDLRQFSQEVGELAEMLTAMGDFCYRLAEVASRLNARRRADS